MHAICPSSDAREPISGWDGELLAQVGLLVLFHFLQALYGTWA